MDHSRRRVRRARHELVQGHRPETEMVKAPARQASEWLPRGHAFAAQVPQQPPQRTLSRLVAQAMPHAPANARLWIERGTWLRRGGCVVEVWWGGAAKKSTQQHNKLVTSPREKKK